MVDTEQTLIPFLATCVIIRRTAGLDEVGTEECTEVAENLPV